MEHCPECGEETVCYRRRVKGFLIAIPLLHCQHCLWTEHDPPENSNLVYEEGDRYELD